MNPVTSVDCLQLEARVKQWVHMCGMAGFVLWWQETVRCGMCWMVCVSKFMAWNPVFHLYCFDSWGGMAQNQSMVAQAVLLHGPMMIATLLLWNRTWRLWSQKERFVQGAHHNLIQQSQPNTTSLMSLSCLCHLGKCGRNAYYAHFLPCSLQWAVAYTASWNGNKIPCTSTAPPPHIRNLAFTVSLFPDSVAHSCPASSMESHLNPVLFPSKARDSETVGSWFQNTTTGRQRWMWIGSPLCEAMVWY